MRRRALIAFLSVCTVLPGVYAGSVHGRTWYVKADHSGDVPTIQAGIDSAAAGDTVLVAAGTYTWTGQGTGDEYGMIYIQRGQNGFVLRSEMGAQATVLDGEYLGRVFFIAGWNDIVVEGFTIRRGMAPSFGDWTGAGLATHLSHDLIRDCIFRDNVANYGAAVWCGGVSSPTFLNCQFYNNQAINGGAVYLINSSEVPTFQSCTFTRNRASGNGGAIYAVHNGFSLQNSTIAFNTSEGQGGAVYARDVWPSSIRSCTITENEGLDGSAIFLNASPSVQLEHSIVAFCSGSPAFSLTNASMLTVACSDVFGNTSDVFPAGAIDAGGNFSLDPMFCGPRGSVIYTIAGGSPCAPGMHPGDAACALIGAFPPACGAVRTQTVTWGQLKAMYR